MKATPRFEQQLSLSGKREGDKTAARMSDESRREEGKGSEREGRNVSGGKERRKYKIASDGVPVGLYALILGDCLAPSPENYN